MYAAVLWGNGADRGLARLLWGVSIPAEDSPCFLHNLSVGSALGPTPLDAGQETLANKSPFARVS